VSRRGFIELCERLAAEDEAAFAAVWRRVGLSVDWSLAYSTIDERSRRTSQLAFLRGLRRGDAYRADAPTLWDVDFQTAVAQAELVDREVEGAWYAVDFRGPAGPVTIETTRPELLPACVAVVAHPGDERYAALCGGTVRTPLFGVEVPVLAHALADPGKGTGLVMVCTFGDLTDVTWWRELALPSRPVVGRDGRLLPHPPPGVPGEPYAELAGLTVVSARRRVAELLRDAGALRGEPRPVRHAVAFYENGRRPLEIAVSGQWYLRNGGRDPALRGELLARGRELRWHPPSMRARYEDWVSGLTGDWIVSRQRFFGVPIPLWYRVDTDGMPAYGDPLPSAESQLPVDPAVDRPPGYAEDQRNRPGGFTADPDVFDTWATSSLTPQIAGGWADDPDLFARVFPYDLRPQSHEIIRTWLFATILRAHTELGVLPWTDAAISGWVLDPDRKKMSKSVGNVVTPAEPLERFGSDAVRYWAAHARLGVDTTYDEGQLRVGRRLAVKLLNVARFVLRLPDAGGVPAEPVDRAALAQLATVVDEATEAFARYDHAGALARIEAHAWGFCNDHVELVKSRAYGAVGADGAASAVAGLRAVLDVLLRLLAPFLPYATEEVWSWWRDGSVHAASWPEAEPLRAAASGADLRLPELASWVLTEVRRAKSEAKLSVRAPVRRLRVRVDEERAALLRHAAVDLALASSASHLELETSFDEREVLTTLDVPTPDRDRPPGGAR
jgi:valyl-tRNA synthetase